MAGRLGSLPRPVLPLLILLAVAVAVLLWLRAHESGDPFTLGGPLLPVPADEVDGFLLTRLDGQYRFDRHENGTWSLGGAVTDFLSRTYTDRFVGNLALAQGGPLLPGTEVEDRRYEFNGEQAIRLTIFTRTAGRISLFGSNAGQ